MTFAVPANEAERLAALATYDAFDSDPTDLFQDLVDLAAQVAGVETAAVMLLDADTAWLKAAHGVKAVSIPRQDTMCTHTILQPEQPLIIPSLMDDPRFDQNPFVIEGGFRAYAGIPLVNSEGYALGALCVLDSRVRNFGPEMVDTLETLARAVVTNLELRRALRRADDAARTDPLTGLPNRRTVMKMIDEASRAGSPMAAIAIDLDFFKETNDGGGHAAGDAVLRATAQRITSVLRQGDHVARLGGDEFLVLLPGQTNVTTVAAIAERISTSLHVPVSFGSESYRVGATLGVALYPRDIQQADKLIRLADEVLMRAKQDKRGSIGFAVREDSEKLSAATAILRAFEADILPSGLIEHATAALQPIVTLPADGSPPQLLAIEALARWWHPDVGSISPSQLFPIIGPDRALLLSQTVRNQAFAAFRAVRDRVGGARLAINLSASEVMRADTAQQLAEQVERAGLSLHDIEVEITEEVLLERVSDRALEQLASLATRGARLVLDDFGTGNSGFSQLLRLPLEGLKLDKQFVQRLGTDNRAIEIVRATISMANSLGLGVVAEGIETEQQADALRTLGCIAAQGFFFGDPMSPEGLEAWIETSRVDWSGPGPPNPLPPN